MLKLMQSKDVISVVADQWGAPTWTKDLSRCITEIIKKESYAYGVYHASGEGKTNWYEFALAIQEKAIVEGMLDKKISVKPLTTEEYPVKAIRPKHSLLNKNKLKNEIGFIFPDWEDSLNLFLQDFKEYI
jgi:dTDP-4-dehydrorhamnose reductase